jgi:hypothetical protein
VIDEVGEHDRRALKRKRSCQRLCALDGNVASVTELFRSHGHPA